MEKFALKKIKTKISFVSFFESWLIRCFALHSVAFCTLQTLTDKLQLSKTFFIKFENNYKNSLSHTQFNFLYLYSKDKSNCVQYLTCSLQKSYCSNPPPPFQQQLSDLNKENVCQVSLDEHEQNRGIARSKTVFQNKIKFIAHQVVIINSKM